jgi:hypothetical protein
MSASTMNPFDDNTLWNNCVSTNILSNLPYDLVCKISEYVPEPKFKAQEFKAGYYSIKPKLLYTDEVKPYSTSYYVDTLVYVSSIKEMNKMMDVCHYAYRSGTDLPPTSKYKLESRRIKKSEYKMVKNIKCYDKVNLYYIDNPNFTEFTTEERKLAFNDKKVIKPWKDYYEDELKKLVSDEYTHHPR